MYLFIYLNKCYYHIIYKSSNRNKVHDKFGIMYFENQITMQIRSRANFYSQYMILPIPKDTGNNLYLLFNIISLMPYNRNYNVLSVSLNKTFPSCLISRYLILYLNNCYYCLISRFLNLYLNKCYYCLIFNVYLNKCYCCLISRY